MAGSQDETRRGEKGEITGLTGRSSTHQSVRFTSKSINLVTQGLFHGLLDRRSNSSQDRGVYMHRYTARKETIYR